MKGKGSLVALVAIILMVFAAIAQADIEGLWKTVTPQGVVEVEFGGCPSPCITPSGSVAINGVHQPVTFVQTNDGEIVVRDNHTHTVVAEGVVDPSESIITVVYEGEVFVLLRAHAVQ